MSCLAIGGCHLEGYPIGYTNSFIYKLSKTFSEDVHVEANFPLSRISRIATLIQMHNPGVVVLQLGNYEFDASIQKTLQLWKKKRNLRTKKIAKSSGNPRLIKVSSKDNSSSGILNNRILSLLQWSWVPLVSAARINLAADHIRALKKITQQHPSIRFIILTPLPLAKATDNWVRKRAAVYYKAQFHSLQNVTVIDTHSTLMHPPIFADPSHLNKIGHALLQHAVEQEMEKANDPAVKILERNLI
jgi:hypothetical protein